MYFFTAERTFHYDFTDDQVSVWALVKLPVNLWIGICFFGWGASCMILAACKNFASLLVMRFLLGKFTFLYSQISD